MANLGRVPLVAMISTLLLLGGDGRAWAAREILAGPLSAEVIRIIDGDTVELRVHVWLGAYVETLVRLEGVDAPELRGHCDNEIARAGQARDLVVALLANGHATVRDIRRDKYGGRVLARVYSAGGEDLSEALLRSRLAIPYHGERRTDWCGDQE
ncbi:micrococcal nuclease [uncultured Gammaproteobacteria bacterium]